MMDETQQGKLANRVTGANMSRRGFLRGAATVVTMGFLELLPRVEGGYLTPVYDALGTSTALALEGSSSFTITVVGKGEVGFHVVDVSTKDSSGNYAPVYQATVTVTSRFNNKRVSGKTDKEGNVILSIESLCPARVAGSTNDYQCNASISVTTGTDSRPRMRDFSAGLVSLEGASGVVIGTHKLDSNDFYVERFTFDDWDVHYTKNSFLRSKMNTSDHAIDIRVAGVTGNVTGTLTVFDAKEGTKLLGPFPANATYDASTTYASARVTGKFLESGHSQCFIKDSVILQYDYSYGGKTKTDKIEMSIEDTPMDKAVVPFYPLPFDADSIFSFSASGDWPCFNGLSFSLLDPGFPLTVSFTPITLIVGIGLDASMVNDKGKLSATAWMNEPHLNAIRRLKNTSNSMDYRMRLREKNKAAVEEDENTSKQNKHILGNFDLTIIARIVACIQWSGLKSDPDYGYKKLFDGKGNFEVGLSLSGGFTVSGTVGPVPMFFSLTAGVAATFAGMLDIAKEIAESTRELALKDANVNLSGAVSLNFKFFLTVSGGVGYSGLCTLGISATVTIPIYFGWKEKKTSGQSDPHIAIGVTFLLEVVFQCLLFKVSGQIWSYAKNPWFDNWKKGDGALDEASVGDDAWIAAGVEPRFLLDHEGELRHSFIAANDGTLLRGSDDPFADMIPVTNDQMHGAREADATKVASDEESLDAASEMARFVAVETDGMEKVFFRADDNTYVYVDKAPCVVMGEDGSVVTELVDCPGTNTFRFVDEPLAAQAEDVELDDQEGPTEDFQAQDAPTDEAGAQAVLTEDLEAQATVAEVPEAWTDESDDPDWSGVAAAVIPNADITDGLPAVELTADEAPMDEISMDMLPADELPADELPADEPLTEEAPEYKVSEDEAEALRAQSDEDAPFAGDPFLGFALPAGEEYSYQYIEGKTTGNYCGIAGIADIAEHDGVTPSVDVVIYDEVFSDPRQRVVSIEGVPHLFRIVTISYPTATGEPRCRSRVVASRFDLASRTWGQPMVIEYGSGDKDLPRLDIFDYDFDIVARPASALWTKGASACLVVTGGLRPNGDNTSVYDAFAAPTVSVVILDQSLRVMHCSVKRVDTSLYPDGNKHTILCPRIADGFAYGSLSGAIAYAFLHRSATEANLLMSSAASVSFGVGYCYIRDGYFNLSANLKDEVTLPSTVTDIEVVAGGSLEKSYDSLLTLLFNRSDGFDVCSAMLPEHKGFDSVVIKHNVSSDDPLPEIKPWYYHGSFLFVKERPATENGQEKDFYLYEGTFDPTSDGQKSLTPRRVDKAGIKSGRFSVSPSGSYLFYYETFRGNPGDDIDPDTGEHTPTYDEVYRIMASRYVDGTFCEDFPFCELNHPVDHFAIMDITQDASTFLATQITDASKSLASLRYIAVPLSLSAEVEAMTQKEDFVYAGKKCPFQVDVRNHGNLIIEGFDLELLDSAGAVIDTVEIGKIDPDNIYLTASSTSWAENLMGASDPETPLRLSAEEEQGLLMPGKLVKYEVEFNIPENWSGEKTVRVRVANARTPDLEAMSEDGNVVRHFHEGVDSSILLHGASAEALLYDPEESQKKNEEENKKRREQLPKTADLLSPLDAVGLAAGGLGALLAGYSARRVEVEREQLEGEGEDLEK